MQPEIRLLAYSAVLGLIHIIAASYAGLQQRGGFRWAAGPRDEEPGPVTGIAGRLDRASKNFFESFPIFAALVLAAVVSGRHNTGVVIGAYLYFWARVAYLPLYAFGVPHVRSLVWLVSVLGILMVLVGVFTKIGPYV